MDEEAGRNIIFSLINCLRGCHILTACSPGARRGCFLHIVLERVRQFRPPIALRTDLSHITTELWEMPVLRMAH